MIKRTILPFLLTVICTTVAAQYQVDSSHMLRVLSFNILHGATTEGNFDLDVIAKLINEVHPDLVALQEVDYKTSRAKNYDLATELGWRTKMAALFGKAMDYDGGGYGEAVLSQRSFLSSRCIALPHSPANEPRAALEVMIGLESGDTLSFIGTHLDHLQNDADRLLQAQSINDHFRDYKHPCILAGDLNDLPGSRCLKVFEEVWTASYTKGKAMPTFPSHQPEKKIDYVMYYPQNRWKVHETTVIQDSIASDHCAYLVVLELFPKQLNKIK